MVTVRTMRIDRAVALPSCADCMHLGPGLSCAAFPDGIPLPILAGDLDHREPIPGDHGIQFEWRDEEEDADEPVAIPSSAGPERRPS